MDYQERPPPPELARHVQCLWHLRDPEPTGDPQTIYPDGRCELIVHLGEPMRRYTLAQGWRTQRPHLFAAQHRTAIRLLATSAVDCVGVRLTAAASSALAGPRLPSLADDIVELESLDSAFATAFASTARDFSNSGDPNALWELLTVRFRTMRLDSLIEAGVAALDASDGRTTVQALARQLGMGVRSFQTRFLSSVGLPPKEYARVRRLQATIRQLDATPASLADVAVKVGFADQAHATRELRNLTGLTPARLRRALVAAREGDATLRMAAAFVRGGANATEVIKGEKGDGVI